MPVKLVVVVLRLEMVVVIILIVLLSASYYWKSVAPYMKTLKPDIFSVPAEKKTKYDNTTEM